MRRLCSCSCTFMIQKWPQGQIYRVFDMFSCQGHNYFLIWHWLTIFSTWVYHHEKMWHVNSRSQFDVDLWPQGQIYRLLSCLHVWPITSVSFNIGIPLWHMGLSPWEDVSGQISWSWYNIDLRPQVQIYKVYDMAFYLSLSFFVLLQSHTLFGTWVVKFVAYIHELCMTLTFDLNIKIIFFTMDLSLARYLCSLT